MEPERIGSKWQNVRHVAQNYVVLTKLSRIPRIRIADGGLCRHIGSVDEKNTNEISNVLVYDTVCIGFVSIYSRHFKYSNMNELL
jgi:hypothetical protein